MESFIRMAEAVIEFESDYSNTPVSEQNKHGLAIQQDELKAMWDKTKVAYDLLSNSDGLTKEDIRAIRKKQKVSFASYVKCMSAMATQLEVLADEKKDMKEQSVREHNIHLPPCDTEVFKGDYLSWPTFRDMFTAIYILNKRLTPVEKLFHLNNKTQGEAKDIVRKCPLTNEGFTTAWKNLSDRYENKRILVNSQLKILFSLDTVYSECGSSIKKLQRDINNCISSLKSHQIDISNWDAIITYLCSTKLPESTLALWEQTIENKTEISKWEDMDRFLSNRFQTLETVSGLKGVQHPRTSKPQFSKFPSEPPQKRLGVFQASVAKVTCQLCKCNEHKLQNCPRFRKLTTTDRIAILKNNNSCLNCLSSGHTVSRCTSSFNCSTCHLRHHTLLHIQTFQPKATGQSPISSPEVDAPSTSSQARIRHNSARTNKNSVNNFNCFANTNKGVLLGTARVNIFYNGTEFSARALIDSGSERSFITQGLKRRIDLPTIRLNAQVSGINNTISAQVTEACLIQLRSPIDPLINIHTTALVLPQLTGNLPTCRIDALTKQAFPDLVLADKKFFVNEQVDLVLGGDIYAQIILHGIRKNVLGTLLAQETVFGWIITGQTDSATPNNKCVSFFNEVSLDKRLKSFWELEEVYKDRIYNEDEIYCEKLYKSTTKRNKDGKYVVSLPFKKDFPKSFGLGPSLKIACSQFFRNETRLAKDLPLQTEYNRVLSEYETLGHMTRIEEYVSGDECANYFLPHHAVKKEDSTTTKVRVVFNASCPTANGTSLNDVIHPGPVLQSDLTMVILRWRLFKYVFNSDIEIEATTQRLIIISQKKYYGQEYLALKSNKPIHSKSDILPLNPYIDKENIIRTGGRLGKSLDLSFNERHPIILPYNSRLSRLIVQFIHTVSLHGENQLMLRLIRTQYWIPRVQNLIRSTIYNCKVCTIYRKRSQSQLMGMLPTERTTFSRTFTNTGVDFTGPFDIKNYNGRGCRVSKGYVCLFVCFATKAIHLEATSDLSTQSFLAAFARFVGRRGCPKNMYSDNGTNFVGASRTLKTEIKAFISDARNSTLSKYTQQTLTWHFIPAAAPHMGGLWEAGVKSFKSHFTKIASNHKYTFEEFTTLLCRVESCLNSRPLSPSSNEPTDLEPLTPGHFLVGGHLLAQPEVDADENRASIVNRWQRLKSLHHKFCKRWKTEYLSELQKRNKWKYPQSNIKKGDLVVIKEDNLPPNEWRLGRVAKLHPGSDGKVRVVDAITERGQVTRPLVKLVLLPANDEQEEQRPSDETDSPLAPTTSIVKPNADSTS